MFTMMALVKSRFGSLAQLVETISKIFIPPIDPLNKLCIIFYLESMLQRCGLHSPFQTVIA